MSLLLALVVAACSGDDGDDDDGGSNTTGNIDCSDGDLGQTLSCSAPELCCAAPMTENHCATSCDTSVVFECDDDSDCGSGVCCWDATSSAGTECRESCTDDFSALCVSSADCPSSTPCCLGAEINGVYIRFCVEEQDFACL